MRVGHQTSGSRGLCSNGTFCDLRTLQHSHCRTACIGSSTIAGREAEQSSIPRRPFSLLAVGLLEHPSTMATVIVARVDSTPAHTPQACATDCDCTPFLVRSTEQAATPRETKAAQPCYGPYLRRLRSATCPCLLLDLVCFPFAAAYRGCPT